MYVTPIGTVQAAPATLRNHMLPSDSVIPSVSADATVLPAVTVRDVLTPRIETSLVLVSATATMVASPVTCLPPASVIPDATADVMAILTTTVWHVLLTLTVRRMDVAYVMLTTLETTALNTLSTNNVTQSVLSDATVADLMTVKRVWRMHTRTTMAAVNAKSSGTVMTVATGMEPATTSASMGAMAQLLPIVLTASPMLTWKVTISVYVTTAMVAMNALST